MVPGDRGPEGGSGAGREGPGDGLGSGRGPSPTGGGCGRGGDRRRGAPGRGPDEASGAPPGRRPHPASAGGRPGAAARSDPGTARVGRELFATRWVPRDPRCHGGDGLGPLYNATSCLECHDLGGPGGAGPAERNVDMATGVGYDYMSSPDNPVPPDGLRPLLTSNSISGRVLIRTAPARTDLARIHPGFRDASSAVLHRNGVDPAYSRWRGDVPSFFRRQGVVISVSARNPPPLFGAGLIAALPDSAFQEAAGRQPPAVRGRAHQMQDGRIGRFGWKAQVPSLDEFVMRACANELGLEVPGHHQAASPLDPDAKAGALDLTAEECRALIGYVRDLPPPIALDPPGAAGSADIAIGRRAFETIGCADCHAPDLGTIRGIYSDLLLHDMGPGLSDPAAYYGDEDDPGSPGSPTVSEWRTPPLWGFRDSAPYLHDGRARSLDEAVAWHGGQGTASAHRFRILSPTARHGVRAFLASLAAPAPAGAPRARPRSRRGRSPMPGRRSTSGSWTRSRRLQPPLSSRRSMRSWRRGRGTGPWRRRRSRRLRRGRTSRPGTAGTGSGGCRPCGPGGDNPAVLREPLDADPAPAGRASVLGGRPTGDTSARPADPEAGAGSP